MPVFILVFIAIDLYFKYVIIKEDKLKFEGENMEDLIGTQQHIRLCYFNLVRMKREKLELQLKLLRGKSKIDEKINKCVEEIVGMDEQISNLRKSCCHPDHDKSDGCPDCGSPF